MKQYCIAESYILHCSLNRINAYEWHVSRTDGWHWSIVDMIDYLQWLDYTVYRETRPSCETGDSQGHQNKRYELLAPNLKPHNYICSVCKFSGAAYRIFQELRTLFALCLVLLWLCTDFRITSYRSGLSNWLNRNNTTGPSTLVFLSHESGKSWWYYLIKPKQNEAG